MTNFELFIEKLFPISALSSAFETRLLRNFFYNCKMVSWNWFPFDFGGKSTSLVGMNLGKQCLSFSFSLPFSFLHTHTIYLTLTHMYMQACTHTLLPFRQTHFTIHQCSLANAHTLTLTSSLSRKLTNSLLMLTRKEKLAFAVFFRSF